MLPRAEPTAEAPLVAGTLSPVPRSRPDQLRIFILGDSQSLLPFGTELQKTLVAAGHEVLFHGVKNGTPYFWQGRWTSPVLTRIYEPAAVPEACGRWSEVSMQPRSIADYVASYDPDVFLFQAGTNFEEDLAGDYTAGILGLIDTSLREARSRGAKVLWIGQPDARDDKKDPAFQERAVTTLRAALATTGASQGYDATPRRLPEATRSAASFAAKPRGDLAVGDRVFHEKFGYGTVSGQEGNKLEIDFESSGRKRVIDSFVKPAE